MMCASIFSAALGLSVAYSNSPSFRRDVKPIFERHCVSCHHGTYNLGNFPFTGTGKSTQEEAVELMIERMRLGDSDWKRMPPPRINTEPVSTKEIAIIEAWLKGGLKP